MNFHSKNTAVFVSLFVVLWLIINFLPLWKVVYPQPWDYAYCSINYLFSCFNTAVEPVDWGSYPMVLARINPALPLFIFPLLVTLLLFFIIKIIRK